MKTALILGNSASSELLKECNRSDTCRSPPWPAATYAVVFQCRCVAGALNDAEEDLSGVLDAVMPPTITLHPIRMDIR
jgi:hypothetical protein